ncbi:MAG TPA: succinate dehydrogenase cytochrome b subunit [Candidatus Sumerlaeota bacterium]|nr:succinate dehydrogenase cytochrome b subunit [Candidatus Sumerlaeota bacterium]
MPVSCCDLWTTVGKKYLAAAAGLVFLVFVIVHLGGNLLLLLDNPNLYNSYSHHLVSLGPLLWFGEAVLLAFFLLHAVIGTLVYIRAREARPVGYHEIADAGKPSRKTLSSRTMIWSGIVILVFTILHLITFKFGEHYTVVVDGIEMRDFHTLVVEVFQKPGYVVWYLLAMVLLGLHLRHGFWSAFQSLGVNHPRYTPFIYGLGTVLAVLLAFGYIVIPIYVYFKY